jgi:hypothetical protein
MLLSGSTPTQSAQQKRAGESGVESELRRRNSIRALEPKV